MASEGQRSRGWPIRIEIASSVRASRCHRDGAAVGRWRSPYEKPSASIAVRGDAAEKFAKILRFPEIAVDRGKTDVGDLIEDRERLHDLLADLLGADFGLTRTFELAHQRIDHALDPLRLDRSLTQRDIDRPGELFTVERLALAVFLDHGQLAKLDPLKCGEARGASGAETPAPYRRPVVGRARILDLGVIRTAERTTHLLLLLTPAS